jgi:hypothetical protein
MRSGAARELQADMERAVAEKEGDGVFKASQAAVKQAILDELNTLGRFRRDRNEGYQSDEEDKYQQRELLATHRAPEKVLTEASPIFSGTSRHGQGPAGFIDPAIPDYARCQLWFAVKGRSLKGRGAHPPESAHGEAGASPSQERRFSVPSVKSFISRDCS